MVHGAKLLQQERISKTVWERDAVDGLPDGREKPGTRSGSMGLRDGLGRVRTCNRQPEQLLMDGLLLMAHDLYRRFAEQIGGEEN